MRFFAGYRMTIWIFGTGSALIMGCETGKAHSSEIKMLNQISNKVDFIKKIPFS